jgi:hypothetical protein
VGQTSFLVTAVARPRRFATPLIAVQNRTLAYFGGSLAGHLTLVLLLGLMPVESSTAAIDLASQEPTSINSKSIEHEDLTAEQEQERDPGSSRTEGKGAQMALAEGAAGTTKSTREDGHIRIKKNADEPQVARTQAIEAATTAGIMGSVSLQDGAAFASLTGVSNLSSGFDDADVYGPLYGAEGEGHGYFGYGRHGFELGGGCAGAGCGIIGTEPGYGKIGTGRRGMNGWDGPGGGGPPGRRHIADVPVAVLGQPTTAGDLDKAIIRRYIKQNLSKIQYCYEKQLLAKSGLDGTVMVNFFITNMGTVKASVGSGMDAEVANCVAYVIAAIEFPKPRGGGGVQVNYPFTFHAAK